MTALRYLHSAPKDLVRAHKDHEIAKGYKELEWLVTHPDMELAWQELAKHAKTNDQAYGLRLFKEIVAILHQLKRTVRLRRAEEKNKFLTVAKQAENLAVLIEHGPFAKKGGNGPFNKLAYEYFPVQVMEINGFSSWGSLDSLSRSAHAHDVLTVWPTMPEMLRELATHAFKHAEEAMESNRLVERQRDDDSYRRLYFVRALAVFMEKEFGSPLYGTLARISGTILQTGLTKEDIEKMVSGSL